MCNRISPGFFKFIPNFYFWGQWWGKKAKNGPKWQKIMSVIFHISGSIHHMIDFFSVHICKVMTSQDAFFIVLKFWCSLLSGGYKGKKWPKMTKISVSLYISGTVPLLVQLCRMMISPAICFHFCSKFWLFGFLRGEGKVQKMTHNCQVQFIMVYISRTVDHIWRLLVHRYKMMIALRVFLYIFYYFFNFCKY